MRPARAAAENTPAKPGRQPSFSQSATVPLEPEPSLASSTEVPRPRRSQKLQSRSRTSGPDQTMTPAPRQGDTGASCHAATRCKEGGVADETCQGCCG